MRVRLLTAVIIALSLALTRISHADGIVLIAGAASTREREIIADTFQAAGKSLTWNLAVPRVPRDVIDASVKCFANKAPWSCIAADLRATDQLVIVQVENEKGGGGPTTVATAHVLLAGAERDVSASRYCELCNEESFKRTLGELSKQSLQQAAERSERTKLVVRSKPDKAWITLDGQTIGATNAVRATYPGVHTLTIRHIGYKTIARDVIAVDGKTVELTFDLEPDGSAPIVARHERPAELVDGSRSTVVPKLLIGTGSLAIAAGIVWIAIDEDQTLHGPQHHYYRDTAAYGVTSLVVGAAATGVGVILLLRANTTSGATIALARGGGATATWIWRF